MQLLRQLAQQRKRLAKSLLHKAKRRRALPKLQQQALKWREARLKTI
jgi:hypothetical protein